ncbi:FAD-binding oxidoreductase [soil metagenome]
MSERASEPGRRLLSGWGKTAPTAATAVTPERPEEVAKLLADPAPGGVLPRGLGRSYGDSAQCGGGTVIDCTRLSGVLALDAAAGTANVAGGTSLDDLMRWLAPMGWFVPVTPGTRFVTVGGAIASDIHGKNHHGDGSFGSAVLSMELALAGGERRTLTPEADPEAFWATVGGMGLTGTVLAATIRLRPISTTSMLVDTERVADRDDCMARMESGDADHRYSVAWIDSSASGAKLGRGVLDRGDHAPLDQLPPRQRAKARRYDASSRFTAPPWMPSGLMNPLTLGVFNELWFHKAPRCRRGHLMSIPAFFYPLDQVAGWNRFYGQKGMLQHQCVVPFGAEETIRVMLERLVAARFPSFVTVLKRFGPGTPGPLSFPMPGWTLNLDIPIGRPELGPLLDGFDELVVEAGGRLYLAKDSRMRPEHLPAMYPRLEEWRAARRRLDPHGVLESDQSRRLGL